MATAPTVQFNTQTGARLAPGQSTMVNGVSQVAGSAYTGANAYGSNSTTNNYNSNTGSMLTPGQVYTNSSGQNVTQGTAFAIPGDTLGSTAPSIPTAPTAASSGTDFNSIMAGINAGTLTGGAAMKAIQDTGSSDQSSLLQSMIDNIGTPPSTADAYKQAQNETGVLEKQQKVNDLTGQLNTITANSQAQQLGVTGQGRGIPEAIIGGQQSEIAKEAAIQALPVSAQLNAAQGNLSMAEQNLNTLFQIKSADATAQYEYKKSIVSAVYDFASKQEQTKMDNAMTLETRAYNEKQTNMQAGKDMIVNAMSQGASTGITSKALEIYKSGGSSVDVAKALGVYAGDYLGNQAKLASIASSKASTAKTYADMQASSSGADTGNIYGSKYTIRAGQDPADIASQNNLTVNELKDLNPQIKDWSKVMPNTSLNVTPAYKAVYGNTKIQDALEKQYTDRIDKVVASRSGDLGVQNAKVSQGIHLKALLDQYKDPITGSYNVPKSQYEELAIGLANLVSGSNTTSDSMRNGIMQKTAKGDIAGAIGYVTGSTPKGSSQTIFQNLADSIDRQATVAENLRNTYMTAFQNQKPTDLDPFRAKSVESGEFPSYINPNTDTTKTTTDNPFSESLLNKGSVFNPVKGWIIPTN